MMLCGNQTIRNLAEIPSSLSKTAQANSTLQNTKAQRQAAARTAAAKSKSKLWGPSHSFDSDDDSYGGGKLGAAPRPAVPTGSWWETMSTAWAEWGANAVQTTCTSGGSLKKARSSLGKKTPMEVVPEEEEAGEESTDPSTQDDSQEHNNHLQGRAPTPSQSYANSTGAHHPDLNDTMNTTSSMSQSPLDAPSKPKTNNSPRLNVQSATAKVEEWTDLFHNACGSGSPCSPQDLEELFGRQRTNKSSNSSNKSKTNKSQSANLGIAPLQFDKDPDEEDDDDDDIVLNNNSSTDAQETPADRRRQRANIRRQRHEKACVSISHAPHEDFEVTSQQDVLITQPTTTDLLKEQSQLPPPTQEAMLFPPAPLETLLVKEDEAAALERSISELTMRSSHQDIHPPKSSSGLHPQNDQRRMAYYAVGRHHRLTSGPRSGGNRRCYFTGKLIFGGGNPFYAGIVQQGLRTLVVFCLPSALGMPHNLPNYKPPPKKRNSPSCSSSVRTGLLQRSRRTLSSTASTSIALSKSPSKLSSTINFDDMSLSIEGDICPNWNLDKDYLLSILPEPDENLLSEMNQRYPEQFETLPVQVRHASCWKLFVKFCFFSGLPIAEGELHYQVRPKLAYELYGEEIILSHEVMEAVNGVSSAEILKLPNQKTFRYLKKHYQQQSAKLPEIVFQRTSWEQVKAEV